MTLEQIFEELCKGNLSILTIDVRRFISDKALLLYNTINTDENYNNELKVLIMICNLLYNRTSMDMLPVEDGMYDLLLERYKKIDPNFQVGSAVVQFEDKAERKMEAEGVSKPITPIRFIDKDKDDIRADFEQKLLRFDSDRFRARDIFYDPIVYKPEDFEKISKRTHDTAHNHPSLVGTLDKCKFVLDADAIEKDVYNDPNVTILERDWFVDHLQRGIITENQELEMMLELKYDGISVEADCTDVVVSARTRGDTGIGVASDLTPMLKGYRFTRNDVLKDRTVGVKFEAIMTYSDLYKVNTDRGYNYANCRTAIIGLFGASDAYLYRDYITLVPLALDLDNVPEISCREEEVELLNRVYKTKGCPLRYCIIKGNYQTCLYLIKKFAEEAFAARQYLDFMFDGIVVSYLDPKIRAKLGRVNYINKYQMAVKFDAQTKEAMFLGYTYEVGQSGFICPMIHYTPVTFNGTIHTKSSGHSYKRFMDLGLREGDRIKVTYTNDVMPYVDKLDCEENRQNTRPIVPFADVCPSCGGPIVVNETGKSAYCMNVDCRDRKIARMVNMLQKLNVKGFAESTIAQLNVFTFKELVTYDHDQLARLIGPGNAANFIATINQLSSNPIEDYRIVGALGFTNVAAKTWKIIFSIYTMTEFIDTIEKRGRDIAYVEMSQLKGIGGATIETILKEYEYFRDDIHFINKNFNVTDTKYFSTQMNGKQIRFSGCRDKSLEDHLKEMGHDADGSAGVTKSTDILLIPYEGYSSGKTAKAPSTCTIVTLAEFAGNMDKYL